MPAYKYATEEGHQRHLEYRRRYYAQNRDRIRARDNENARRKRVEDPGTYRRMLEKRRVAPKLVTKEFRDNPDLRLIAAAIAREDRERAERSKR